MTQGWAKYHWFNQNRPTVMVIDIDGRERWITTKQEQVLVAAIRLRGRGQYTVTAIAASIGQCPSSVSRTLIKLESFGLIAYDTKRGRYGGVEFITVLIAEAKDRAQEAWERLKAARQKVQVRLMDRLTRTGYFNVASMVNKDATLTMDWEEYDDIIASEHSQAAAEQRKWGRQR
jgi:predicted transcriptional regulator